MTIATHLLKAHFQISFYSTINVCCVLTQYCQPCFCIACRCNGASELRRRPPEERLNKEDGAERKLLVQTETRVLLSPLRPPLLLHHSSGSPYWMLAKVKTINQNVWQPARLEMQIDLNRNARWKRNDEMVI